MSSVASTPAARAPKGVIIVDDDDDVRRSVTYGLRRQGYSVNDFASGLELLSLCDRQVCDCLLIDYKLPHIDGLDLLPRLRQGGLDSPALLITGLYSGSLSERAKAAGYAAVIEKPVHVSELVTHIVRCSGEGDRDLFGGGEL